MADPINRSTAYMYIKNENTSDDSVLIILSDHNPNMLTNIRSSNMNVNNQRHPYIHVHNDQSTSYADDNGLDYVVLRDTPSVIANSNDIPPYDHKSDDVRVKTQETNTESVGPSVDRSTDPSVDLQNTKYYNIRLNIMPRILYENMDTTRQSPNNPISYMLLFSWSIISALLYYYTNIETRDIDSTIHTFLKCFVMINVYNALAYIVIHINSTILFGMRIINMLRLYIVLSVISNIYLAYLFNNLESEPTTYIFIILIINIFLCICMVM